MKVKELIVHLRDLDGEAEVHLSYNYGDHWRTEVAPVVRTVDTGHVVHSGYHDMDKVVDEDDEDDVRRDRAKWREVVLISS